MNYVVKFTKNIKMYVDNFELLVDLSHLPQTYESSKFTIQTIKPYITDYYIGNCVMKDRAVECGDNHPRFWLLNGDNDVKEVKEFIHVMNEEVFFDEENPYIILF